MNSSLAGSLADQTELDGLTLDISDDALERLAAVADGQHVTVGHCTHWYSCDWPLSPAESAADAGKAEMAVLPRASATL